MIALSIPKGIPRPTARAHKEGGGMMALRILERIPKGTAPMAGWRVAG